MDCQFLLGLYMMNSNCGVLYMKMSGQFRLCKIDKMVVTFVPPTKKQQNKKTKKQIRTRSLDL